MMDTYRSVYRAGATGMDRRRNIVSPTGRVPIASIMAMDTVFCEGTVTHTQTVNGRTGDLQCRYLRHEYKGTYSLCYGHARGVSIYKITSMFIEGSA